MTGIEREESVALALLRDIRAELREHVTNEDEQYAEVLVRISRIGNTIAVMRGEVATHTARFDGHVETCEERNDRMRSDIRSLKGEAADAEDTSRTMALDAARAEAMLAHTHEAVEKARDWRADLLKAVILVIISAAVAYIAGRLA